MTHKILLVGCIGLLFSCDTRAPWVTRDNSPPVMRFLKTDQNLLTDSAKFTWKAHTKKEISVSFSVADENHNLGAVSIAWPDNWQEDTGSVFPVKKLLPLTLDGKFTAIFSITGGGTAAFKIKAEDKLGGVAHLTYQVIVFQNLPPKASFVAFRNTSSTYAGAYTLDASSSTDRDEKFGGAISYYRFTIKSLFDKKSETFWTTKPLQAYSFVGGGQFTIILEVTDNDGDVGSTEKTIMVEF